MQGSEAAVLDGIIIGGVGGAFAGLTVWFVDYIHKKVVYHTHKNRVYRWLLGNTSPEQRFRSTRTIASHNNLTEDRVRYVCSHDERIRVSDGETNEVWRIATNAGSESAT